jgi:hypothetical protein
MGRLKGFGEFGLGDLFLESSGSSANGPEEGHESAVGQDNLLKAELID